MTPQIEPDKHEASAMKPVRIPDLRAMKQRGEKISMLTTYDATFARIFDHAGIDLLFVGDSLGMVILGADDTLQVTMDDIVRHTRAVRRGTRRAMVVSDMPFMSYQVSIEEAVRNAGRLIQEGAMAVKLEGGKPVIETVHKLVSIGIPVIGHLGLTPQSVNQLGGFRRQGQSLEDRKDILEDALLLQQAGACAIVLECIPSDLAQQITAKLEIPTIGIGSGAECDGQVLVSYDLLGLTAKAPSFAPRFANLGELAEKAVREFNQQLKAQPAHKV